MTSANKRKAIAVWTTVIISFFIGCGSVARMGYNLYVNESVMIPSIVMMVCMIIIAITTKIDMKYTITGAV